MFFLIQRAKQKHDVCVLRLHLLSYISGSDRIFCQWDLHKCLGRKNEWWSARSREVGEVRRLLSQTCKYDIVACVSFDIRNGGKLQRGLSRMFLKALTCNWPFSIQAINTVCFSWEFNFATETWERIGRSSKCWSFTVMPGKSLIREEKWNSSV